MSVLIRDLAKELQIDRSQLRKWILKHATHVNIFKIRENGQQVIAVSESDANLVREGRRQWNGKKQPKCESPKHGVFYAIRLIPEIHPQRIKFGYSSELDSRLQSHRCTCPNAAVICSWRCKPGWESCALDVIKNADGVAHAGGEVFDCEEIDTVKNVLDQFFSLLYEPKTNPDHPNDRRHHGSHRDSDPGCHVFSDDQGSR